MSLAVRALAPEEVVSRLNELAALRIEVFRDWPYLYDGDAEYERRYLRPYSESRSAIVVAALDGDEMVGAATGAPLAEHADEFAEALDGTGLKAEEVFYLAESVLRAGHRGQGIGHAFFNERERHAQACGFRHALFCSVIRPDDHLARPREARDLAPFWRTRGYRRIEGASARFSWRDVGDSEPSEKRMAVWLRDLDA